MRKSFFLRFSLCKNKKNIFWCVVAKGPLFMHIPNRAVEKNFMVGFLNFFLVFRGGDILGKRSVE